MDIFKAPELLRAWSKLSADLSARTTSSYGDVAVADEEGAVKPSKKAVVVTVSGMSRIREQIG